MVKLEQTIDKLRTLIEEEKWYEVDLLTQEVVKDATSHLMRLECMKIASTFKNATVTDLVEKANSIYKYINKL